MAKISCGAWIGDISYIAVKPGSPAHTIFDTKADAQRAGWEHPHRVTIIAFTRPTDGETK